jgi:arginase family enzyme
MSQPDRRKALRAQYEQTPPEAGVYRIVNNRTNKALLGSTLNLAGLRNRLAFARSTNSPGGLDLRLSKDIRQYGFDAFSLEVLEVLEVTPEMTRAEILADLATLEALWREKSDPALLY